MPVDERLKLAYDAASSRLAQQDTTLGNLRNRATGLLTFAALITSFSAGLGLLETGSSTASSHELPHWAAYTLLGVLVAIGVLVMFVVWPVRRFAYGPDSALILQRTADGVDIDPIVQDVANKMTVARALNEDAIHLRMSAFRWGALLLVVEVVVLILGFVSS